MIRGLKRGRRFTRAHKFSLKRHKATISIGLEVERRMNDANRTIEEALGDLEGARKKLVVRGGHGTIASLAYAIRAKNGLKMDQRLKPVILEY
jgi:chaperonin GroEL (HSP60 family)